MTTNPAIPDRIKIGGVTYTVKVDTPRFVPDGGSLVGNINYVNAEIYLNPSQAPGVMAQTFLHEVLHGVLRMMGRADLNDNDDFVDGLAYNLHQIMVDNGWTMGAAKQTTAEMGVCDFCQRSFTWGGTALQVEVDGIERTFCCHGHYEYFKRRTAR